MTAFHSCIRHRPSAVQLVLSVAVLCVAWLMAPLPARSQDSREASSPDDPGEALSRAIDDLHRQLGESSDSADVLVRLGEHYIKRENPDSARWALELAVKLDSTRARAHAGLGHVHAAYHNDPETALSHLQTALRLDSTRAEPYHDTARAHLMLKQKRLARKAADTAIRRDPEYAPPYHLLARLYEEEGNEQAARTFYKRYLEQDPSDQTAAYEFALGLTKQRKFAEVEELAGRMEDVRSWPLLAQAQMQRRDYEAAIVTFARYIDQLEPEEQALYDDISFAGLPHEVKAYQSTNPETREAFLRGFWLRKDPFKTTGGAMRRSEHYSRVWYARTFFGERRQPWDRRGEVYIRYGEPDFRSTSRDINAQIPLDVQRVQDMMAYQLYGERALSMTFVGPVFPIRNARSAGQSQSQREFGNSSGPPESLWDGEVGLEFYKPVSAASDFTSQPWEVWIYKDVDKGLEIAFTDEFHSGIYNYAPVPTLSPNDQARYDGSGSDQMRKMVQRLNQLSPAARVARISRTEPERYDLSFMEPLDFYYEALAFKGKDGATELQVNIGLPIDSVAETTDPDTTVVVERRVALYDPRTTELMKRRQMLGVPVTDSNRGLGLIAVDRATLDASPGDYELAIEASRTNTDKVQVYRQTVSLPDFNSGRVMLSDIQVARKVMEGGPDGSRFARGDLDILPAPSRSFRAGEPIFVYFEIYNLSRDTFGNTRYEVAYEVHAKTLGTGGRAARLLARIRRRTGESIEVRYEQVGTETQVADYVELDLGQVELGSYVLKMDVKDLNNNLAASREGIFRISEERSSSNGR